MKICPNVKCMMHRRKGPQFGAKCIVCQTPLPEEITSTPVVVPVAPPKPPLTRTDWKNAARYAAYYVYDKQVMNAWTSGNWETAVKLYYTNIGIINDLDDDAVRQMAKVGLEREEGAKIIDGWGALVIGSLRFLGESPALSGNTRARWGKLSGWIKARAQEVNKPGGIIAGTTTRTDGTGITINRELLNEPDQLRFALGHETGHLVDFCLRGSNDDDWFQKDLRHKSTYPSKSTYRDHELEYFADAFATLLLLTNNMAVNKLLAAARVLFGGATVTEEHPTGADRLKNIAQTHYRHAANFIGG